MELLQKLLNKIVQHYFVHALWPANKSTAKNISEMIFKV
jgi:hypothetical protein